MYRRPLWVYCLLFVCLMGGVTQAQTDTPPPPADDIQLDDRTLIDRMVAYTTMSEAIPRTYEVFAPSIMDALDEGALLPMVVILHGRPGNGREMAFITQFNRIAEANGVIAVYPDGVNNGWNYVRGSALYEYVGEHDDSAFLRDLVGVVADAYPVDVTRVYAMGFSNGGFMTQRLACEARGMFAAFAVVGATGFWGLPDLCDGVAAAPMLLMHGTNDRSVPWQGTPQDFAGQTVYTNTSIPQTLTFWGAQNGCTDTYDRTDIPASDARTSVSRLEYMCEDAPLVFYGILNGGHNWVGVDSIRPEIAGLVNKDINASAVIWQFFRDFSNPMTQE